MLKKRTVQSGVDLGLDYWLSFLTTTMILNVAKQIFLRSQVLKGHKATEGKITYRRNCKMASSKHFTFCLNKISSWFPNKRFHFANAPSTSPPYQWNGRLPPIVIDEHVCWHSKRRLLFIVCRTRKTNLRFPFAANKRKLTFFVSSVFRFYIYIHIYWNGSIC